MSSVWTGQLYFVRTIQLLEMGHQNKTKLDISSSESPSIRNKPDQETMILVFSPKLPFFQIFTNYERKLYNVHTCISSTGICINAR